MTLKRSQMSQAEKFFYDQAGYSYDPKKETRAQGRRRGAIMLARAEEWAREKGISFIWEHDPDGDLGDHAYWCAKEKKGLSHEHEILWAVARGPSSYGTKGEILASLGSIIDPDRNYARVIEAELALEAESA